MDGCHADLWTALRHRSPLCMVVVVLPLVAGCMVCGSRRALQWWYMVDQHRRRRGAHYRFLMHVLWVTNPLDMPRNMECAPLPTPVLGTCRLQQIISAMWLWV